MLAGTLGMSAAPAQAARIGVYVGARNGVSSAVSRPGICLGLGLLEWRRLGSRLLEFRGRARGWSVHSRRSCNRPWAGLLPAFRDRTFPQVASPSATCTARPLQNWRGRFFCIVQACEASHRIGVDCAISRRLRNKELEAGVAVFELLGSCFNGTATKRRKCCLSR